MTAAIANSGCLKNARALRIEARRRGGFDDIAVEKAANEGFRPQHWIHADDLLPRISSIPRSVGESTLRNRDWKWLLEVWLDRPDSPERDQMLAECREHLGMTMDDKQRQDAA